MSEQHQYGRLPAERQGEEGYETAAKYCCLVRINRVSNTLNIHIPHPKIALRNTAEGRKTGGRCRASLRIR